jgi:hypothetical protein
VLWPKSVKFDVLRANSNMKPEGFIGSASRVDDGVPLSVLVEEHLGQVEIVERRESDILMRKQLEAGCSKEEILLACQQNSARDYCQSQ